MEDLNKKKKNKKKSKVLQFVILLVILAIMVGYYYWLKENKPTLEEKKVKEEKERIERESRKLEEDKKRKEAEKRWAEVQEKERLREIERRFYKAFLQREEILKLVIPRSFGSILDVRFYTEDFYSREYIGDRRRTLKDKNFYYGRVFRGLEHDEVSSVLEMINSKISAFFSLRDFRIYNVYDFFKKDFVFVSPDYYEASDVCVISADVYNNTEMKMPIFVSYNMSDGFCLNLHDGKEVICSIPFSHFSWEYYNSSGYFCFYHLVKDSLATSKRAHVFRSFKFRFYNEEMYKGNSDFSSFGSKFEEFFRHVVDVLSNFKKV